MSTHAPILSPYDETLKDFFKQGYNTREIIRATGDRLNIWKSIRTTQKRLRELGLNRKGYEIPIDELIPVVRQMLEECESNGADIIWRRLRREKHLLVKRQTVRDLIKIIQPAGAERLRKGNLKRRVYKVKGPNHIWHIDRDDKLKRYGLCLHGCIDGFSRKIIWMHCARMNKNPGLVASYFLNAVRQVNGAPQTARMDRGTENNSLADIQTLLRAEHNDGNLATMFGSSNHNQRIERFWSTLRKVLLRSYEDLCADLVTSGLLDMSSATELECFVFCFINVFRKELDRQVHIWNHHRIGKIKSSELPSGIPLYLYTQPESLGFEDRLKPINLQTLDACQFMTSSVDDIDTEFEEWALQTMLAKRLPLPNDKDSALHVFGHLISALREP